MYRRRAFTVPEMLAVVAIIVIIMSMLLPSLRAAREEGRSVVCLAQLSQIGRATINFTVEHRGILPGIWGSVWVGPEAWQGCWMSNPVSGSAWASAPETGTIFPYMNGNAQAYRCPSLVQAPLGTGLGSNGRFDYSAFHAFAGAHRYRVPNSSQIVPYNKTVSTPWIIEESPMYYLNNCCIEGGFGGGDKIGSWHNGNGNVVAIGGDAYRIQNTTDLSSYNYNATTPSGATVNLSSHASGWGGWDKR